MEDTNNIKVATWNLCLGLANKKELVSQIIKNEQIDICCMQEIDIPLGYNCNLLSFKGYNLITENNNVKSRTGLYIKNGIDYSRRSDLEGLNNGLIKLFSIIWI